jgi:hypothetical protein
MFTASLPLSPVQRRRRSVSRSLPALARIFPSCSAEKGSAPPVGFSPGLPSIRTEPGGTCSRLHRYATPRHATEYLQHGFRCGRQFMFEYYLSCFMQDAVRTGAISQIQTNRELPLENVFSTRPHSANLLHCRSPFLCASSTFIIGSVTHPVGDRPSPSKTSMRSSWLGGFGRR